MREIELKLVLDAAQLRRLRAAPAIRSMAAGPSQTRVLHSFYYDTDADDLKAAGIALRLRRIGRQWVQTVKRADSAMQSGLSQPIEIEFAVDGHKLALGRIPDHDLREELIGLSRDGLSVVAETKFKRTSRILVPTDCVEIELAIDAGQLISGERAEDFVEAELELKRGSAADLYKTAALLLTQGPVRYSVAAKSERARALPHRDGPAATPLRKARPVRLNGGMSAEAAAMAIFREGIDHALSNLARTIDSEDVNGPHQLRVGLRRLRSAFSAFRGVLGRGGLEPWAIKAREIGAQAGALRDLDVMAFEIVAPMIDRFPEEPGFQALHDALVQRRREVFAKVRPWLAGKEACDFAFGLPGFVEARGWLDANDHDQTLRLAQPVVPYAIKTLRKRWKAMAAYGSRIETLTVNERHEMRKEIKKLRYVLDGFSSLFPSDSMATFGKRVKQLQTSFGALNDSAMAEMILSAPDAPGADQPSVARAAGRIIGHFLAEADREWPGAVANWQALSSTPQPWRNL
ncbi:MAG: CYTH and CHAD domain-containing protein [Pseudomonadota bacterium]